MSVVRIGATKQYSENWENIFSGGRGSSKSKATTGSKTKSKPAKKSPKKAAKPTGKKKAAGGKKKSKKK